jgi:hypothetical protein
MDEATRCRSTFPTHSEIRCEEPEGHAEAHRAHGAIWGPRTFHGLPMNRSGILVWT